MMWIDVLYETIGGALGLLGVLVWETTKHRRQPVKTHGWHMHFATYPSNAQVVRNN